MKYNQFILEHKFWGKSISEFLEWIKLKSNTYWILLDTETTGLPDDGYEVQLTQLSCIVIKYNFDSNTFSEIESYNKKIKLTPDTLSSIESKRIKNVLSFNHYGEKGIKFHDESESLVDFNNFINKYENSILVIQNAKFDMKFINTRNKKVKFTNEVIDTKQIAQLFYLPCLQKLSETNSEYKELVTKIGTSDRDNGLISSSLSKIGPALGINMSGYHDALTDCKLMMEMFVEMIKFLKVNKNVNISKYQGERVNKIRN